MGILDNDDVNVRWHQCAKEASEADFRLHGIMVRPQRTACLTHVLDVAWRQGAHAHNMLQAILG